jgi:endogenous inhibitor of DNA gyrase (YacG/DUF329 family)
MIKVCPVCHKNYVAKRKDQIFCNKSCKQIKYSRTEKGNLKIKENLKIKAKKDLVHAVAYCSDCNFKEEYFLNAQKAAKNHYKKTGHEVLVETGYCQVYGEKN